MTAMIGRGATGSSIGGVTGGTIVPKGFRRAQLQQFTPEQTQLFKQLFSNVGQGSFLSKLAGGDQSQFEQIEAPALQQFNQILGGLGSRFSGAGGLGARHSSGFQQATTQASSDFAKQLQAQRLGLQRQAIQDLFGLSESLLGQRPYEQFLAPKQRSFLQELGIAGAQGVGQALGTLPAFFI